MAAPSGLDYENTNHLREIAQALNRIANCLEADERRKRRAAAGGWSPTEEEPEAPPT